MGAKLVYAERIIKSQRTKVEKILIFSSPRGSLVRNLFRRCNLDFGIFCWCNKIMDKTFSLPKCF